MRKSGILMPVSSLPSPCGIGCFSEEAYRFADRLKEAGQAYWQILPLGPTGYGDSPYQAFSAFAGNPYFIDLDQLCRDGLLKAEEYKDTDFGSDPERTDYGKLYGSRMDILRKAYERAELSGNRKYEDFCSSQKDWLDDYALYMTLKGKYGQKSWNEWETGARMREDALLRDFTEKYADEISFYKFLQYEFMQQWIQLRSYVNGLGIRIIGDIPIYVAFDSADSWAESELFQFDENRIPVEVAGCPPDAFAADGQLWGNPLYDWEYHERTGYAWWIRRLERCFELYDVVRVDHFRGFDEYFSIPYGAKTAAGGRWRKGPGMQLFDALREHFGSVSIIAEDLGYLTQSVMELVQQSGYPGMKVMEFAFDSREAGDYMPYNYPHNCVVYTGTHDNQTLYAWYDELADADREYLDEYLQLRGKSREEIVWSVIRLTLSTVADTAIIPMQDYLCLGEEARMNKPSTMGGNWQWRMKKDAFDKALAEKIRRITKLYGR